MTPSDVFLCVSHLLESRFAPQRSLLLSWVGCVNGRPILSTMVIMLPHACIQKTQKKRMEKKTHASQISTAISADTASFACKKFSKLCHHPQHLEFMKPNEFKDHSRLGHSLRRLVVCRCMGTCRWVFFLLLCYLYVRIFISFTSVSFCGGGPGLVYLD